MNRTIDMALGSKIYDRTWGVSGEQSFDQRLITDIPLYKGIARVAIQAGETLAVARVGQLVEIEHRLVALA